ncbi:MAG: hypothetical protein ACI9EV_002485, partial [Urechidicola sp.]
GLQVISLVENLSWKKYNMSHVEPEITFAHKG